VLDPTGAPVSSVLSFYFRRRGPAVLRRRRRARAGARRQRLQVLGTDAARRGRGIRVFDYGRSKRDTRIVRLQEELGVRAAAAQLRVPAAEAPTAFRRTTRPNPRYRAFIGLWRRLPRPLAKRARAVHRPQPGLGARWSRFSFLRTGFHIRRTKKRQDHRTLRC